MDRDAISRAVEKAVRELQAEGGSERKHVCTCNISLKVAGRLPLPWKSAREEMGVKAVVCVADAGGHPVLVHSMDGAYIASYDIAVNKAFTVVALKMSTQALSSLAQPVSRSTGFSLLTAAGSSYSAGESPSNETAR